MCCCQGVGLSPDDLTFLGYPDFGTLNILCAHWKDNSPYKGLLTRATAVPYKNALRPGALYKGEEVLHDLKTVLHQFNPTKIFLSHAADHNRDHRALYVFTRAALWESKTEQVNLYPYLAHYHHWPTPKGFYPVKPLTPPAPFEKEISFKKYLLHPVEVERNLKALEKHKTQYASNTEILSSFIRANELFGDFPNIVLDSGSPSVEVHHPAPLKVNTNTINVVGAHLNSIGFQNDILTMALELSGFLAEEVEVSIHCFGYQQNKFAEMPKLNIKTGIFGHIVFDQTHIIPRDTVQISRKGKKIIIHVPYTAMGNPERVLVSARLYMAELPIDWIPWRVVELPHRK